MSHTPPFDGFTTQPLEALPQPTQRFIASEPDFDITPDMYPVATSRFPNKKKLTRIVAIIILLALCIALYFTWHTSAPTTTTPIISQQNFSGTTSNSSANTS